jgi:cobyrinic acid a,c-diamide synthase
MQTDRERTISSIPRILIAGLRGSGGKTLVSMGLSSAWRRRGHKVTPFKKGPDYIDAAWLGAAAGRPCRNLDLFMMSADVILRSFLNSASGEGIAVIEGNRGLFDGMDALGTYSTAEIAKLLHAPVIIVCDSSKTTRTLGAILQGCQRFDPSVDIRGVVLNRVAQGRHEAVLREVVAKYCGLPVLGAIPRLLESYLPERHLGLVPPQEHGQVPAAVKAAEDVVEKYLDQDALLGIARAAPPLALLGQPGQAEEEESRVEAPNGSAQEKAGARIENLGARRSARRTRICVLRDEAFQFYYPENLEALERMGADLIVSSPLHDKSLPEADAVYIGGGFPETFAAELAANSGFRDSVAAAVEMGLPVYAECAGAVYLGRSLIIKENTYPMTGAFPVVFGFESSPQGHGYAVMEVQRDNPFYAVGDTFHGHEFHYSRVLEMNERELSFAFRVRRGYGIDGERDGICRRNALATYCHIHALGVKSWAGSLVQAGQARKPDPRSS